MLRITLYRRHFVRKNNRLYIEFPIYFIMSLQKIAKNNYNFDSSKAVWPIRNISDHAFTLYPLPHWIFLTKIRSI